MAVKLVLFLVILAIVVSVAVAGAFWYLKNRAEMKHEQQMTEKELEQKQIEKVFDDE